MDNPASLIINPLHQEAKNCPWKRVKSKLPEILDAEQKRNKVKNLLAGMSRHLLITADGKRGPTAVWRLLPAGLDKLATEGKS